MKRAVSVVLAGAAGLAALAIAVPGVASADGPQCGPEARAAAREQARPQIQAFLDSHPDFKAEREKIKGLPKEQRKAERQAFAQAHPQEVQDFKAAAQPIIDYRHACHK
ncbi:hemophore-related protein [Nocardia transvalensis]|uniref:Hemophore-related protein n=1 Tax=Nocardia transvalensis TaxID=37333 RepID=A0A7W9PB48_9NOCA|nr:hemophore-related protein [Nocardia transvalensis]MBB5912443.1 hemophore-related protein [Nocardia transvalensis]